MQAGLNSFTLSPKRPVKHQRGIKYDVLVLPVLCNGEQSAEKLNFC